MTKHSRIKGFKLVETFVESLFEAVWVVWAEVLLQGDQYTDHPTLPEAVTMRVHTSNARSSTVSRCTPQVPPAWPGRAVAPADYKNRTTPKVHHFK